MLEDSKLSDRVTMGILATLLSTASDVWAPAPSLLEELEKLAQEILGSDVNLVGVVEPLVFALARHGRREQHRKYLRTVIDDCAWRRADIRRVGEYYEDYNTQIRSMKQHLEDQRRDGLLGANDVVRLLSLMRLLNRGAAFSEVERMMRRVIEISFSSGEETLGRWASDECERVLSAKARRTE